MTTAQQPDLPRQDAQPSNPLGAAPSTNVASSSQPRFLGSKSFRRSSGSFSGAGVFTRFIGSSSASSSRAQAGASNGAEPIQKRPSLASRISSRASRTRLDATGVNLAELSKPNGKFQSGIKWTSDQQAPEPFMEASDSTAAERELALQRQLQSSLASGSTAAAQAHAQNRGLGQPTLQPSSSVPSPLYPTDKPASSATTTTTSSSKTTEPDLPTASQTIAALDNSGVHPDILGSTRSSTMQPEPQPALPPALAPQASDSGKPTSLDMQLETASADATTPCITPPVKSRQPSHSEQPTVDNHMVARAAQLVLEAARQQARVETRKKGKSAPASPKRSTFSLSPIATTTTTSSNDDDAAAAHSLQEHDPSELERTPSQRARSKSDAGARSQVKRRKSFLRSMSSKARRERAQASTMENADSEPRTPDASSPTMSSGTTSGTVTPGGRRRRYVDTRDLDLLARELAAEAIAEQLPQPPFARPSRSGSSSPHRIKASAGGLNDPRRRSFPSILEDSPLQDDSIAPPRPTPNGLKPMTPLSSSRPTARAKAADGPSDLASASASASHSDPTKGLVPKEMFLGIGGSPYPSLPPPSSRSTGLTLDTTDPFGIPLTHESSPFDATSAYANKTSVYHTPNQVAFSRSRSNDSSGSESKANKRRPVLTMTMHDPEAELQGLTKPPKDASTKRLTPFGSRASSRAPSPRPSHTDLKQAAAAQDEASERALSVEEGNPGSSATECDDRSTTRRNSIAPSEKGALSGLASVQSTKASRIPTMFRSNKSKARAEATKASADSPPGTSALATPAGEVATLSVSPQSAAVSAGSDADVSPVAFRTIDLPPARGTARSSKPPSLAASRRSSMVLDSTEPMAAKKRPMRALLRRLSSFSKKKENKTEKLNVPDVSTMPAVDMDKLRQLSETEEVKADGVAADSEAVARADAPDGDKEEGTVDAVAVGNDGKDAAQEDPIDTHADKGLDKGLMPALQGLDLSKASPAPVNMEMAKNGFGTRCAYKIGGGDAGDAGEGVEAEEADGVMSKKVDGSEATDAAEEGAREEEAMATREDVWDGTRAGQIVRSDSQTPSSEDSFFLGSGPSITSRPGSGALMKHGSESAISEELHTPDPSTAYLPATKTEEAMLEEAATLSSTVTNATVAAAAAAAAAVKVVASTNGDVQSPVVTALPSEEGSQASPAN